MLLAWLCSTVAFLILAWDIWDSFRASRTMREIRERKDLR
jgi:hypothetical protein